MTDIARLAKVSKPTVSRALSNSPLVNEKTRLHVLEVARQHGYAVNRNAQKLRHHRTNTIAVSLDFISHKQNHIADPFIFDLLAGVSEALGNFNQDLLLCAPTHNNLSTFQQILSSRGADGFIFLGQGHREALLRQLAELGAPMVVWGSASEDTPYCVVGSDNFRGGQLAAEYFAKQGRDKLLFVGDTSFREIYLRRAGLEQGIAKLLPNATITDLPLSDFSFETSFAAAQDYLRTNLHLANGVFAYSDTTAMALIRACQDHGLQVPKDVNVVGYNDIPAASYFSPALTTIRQDTYQAGQVMAGCLIDMLDSDGKPNSTVIGTELIERDS